MFLVLVLVAVIPCLLDNSFLQSRVNMAVYLSVKIVFGLWLIVATVLVLCKKLANTSGVILLSIAGVVQLVPLLARYVLPLKSGLIWVIVISVVMLIVAVGSFGMLMISNKKMVESDKKFEGKTIEVKDDKQMYDENNHFTGVK